MEEVAPHALTTEKVRAGEKLGVYWEAYGTEAAGEPMKVSLTVVREVEESGFLRRQAKTLRVVREATPVSITVQDMSALGTRVSPRAIELDISTLSKGNYVVQLEITVNGQPPPESPALQQYTKDLRAWLEASGMVFFDDRDNPAMWKLPYADGDHIAGEGMTPYAELLAARLEKIRR